MKAAPLALLLVCAPAAADVALPQPTAKKSWHHRCAARIDAAAKRLGLWPGASVTRIPLVREDSTPNGVTYVEFGNGELTVAAGEDSDRRANASWTRTVDNSDRLWGLSMPEVTWFRRLHNRFGKLEGGFSAAAEREFKLALDDCLKMGESK